MATSRKYSPLVLLILFSSLSLCFGAKKAEDEGGNEVEEEKDPGVKDFSHGFGTDIDWVDWDEAISAAMEENKPIALLIHKTWCGACQQLKKSFQTSNKRKELIELSRRFIMSNVEDDDEPEDEVYAPDGRYIPRLFFLDKHGDPLSVDNKKNYPSNAYYFPQEPDVIRGMKEALKIFNKEKTETAKAEDADGGSGAEEAGAKEEKKAKSEKKESAEPKGKKEEAAKEKEAAAPAEKTEKAKEAKKAEKSPTDKSADAKKTKAADKEGKEKAEEEGAKSGGCPHAAAAKKAKEAAEAKKEKTSEKATQTESKKKAGGEEKADGKAKSDEQTAKSGKGGAEGKKKSGESKTQAKKTEL